MRVFTGPYPGLATVIPPSIALTSSFIESPALQAAVPPPGAALSAPFIGVTVLQSSIPPIVVLQTFWSGR